jgi:transposase InsO family protein
MGYTFSDDDGFLAASKEAVMPWKALSMYEQRLALIHRIVTLKQAVGKVAKEFGVSRKTVHKWLRRYRRHESVADRPRRPKRSPGKTCPQTEDQVLDIRRRHNWGPRKIHRLLINQQQQQQQQQQCVPCDPPLGAGVPSLRTVARILTRNDCVGSNADASTTTTPPPPNQFFERGAPNQLWQLDHKGPIEVARQRVWPLSVLDDCSRYCLCFQRVCDTGHQATWDVLWQLFERYGLPDSILCDNAFAAPVGLSWFDARLVRLQIQPMHGRPYHPQTQGKVERFNGTAKRELLDFSARRDSFEHFDEDAERFRMVYNTIRPHEALGDVPPISRWKSSVRLRPPHLPEVSYPPGTITRRVSQVGDFHYRNARIVVGRSLARQQVRIEERQADIGVYYCWKLVRVIANDQLGGPRSNQNKIV